MTHRERIRAAVAGRETDILPAGFKATDDVLQRLQAHYAAGSLPELLGRLPVDTFGGFNNCRHGVQPRYVGGPAKVLYPDRYPDGCWDTIYGYQRRWVDGACGRTDEVVGAPLAGAGSPAELERHSWPQADWFDYDAIGPQCDAAGDYAVIFVLGGLGHVANLIGFERLLTDMLLDPPCIDVCFAKLTDFYLEFLERTLAAAAGRIDIVCVQDDFGTQQGPLLGLETYRRFYRPHHRRLFEVAHRHGVGVMMHSCGAVGEFIPDFIEIGADILDPVQTTATGMNPAWLKREYGAHLCFHGGIDTQGTLVSGSPEAVRRQIDGLVSAFGPRGFILAPAHYIQADAPLENVLAAFEHVEALRRVSC